MSLDIKGGSLSRRIKFYAPKDGVSTFRSIDDYDLLRECWAYIEQVSARSQIYAGIEVQDGQYTISVRYFHGLHIDCIVDVGGYLYRINSIQPKYAKGQIIVSCHYDSRINQNNRVTT